MLPGFNQSLGHHKLKQVTFFSFARMCEVTHTHDLSKACGSYPNALSIDQT